MRKAQKLFAGLLAMGLSMSLFMPSAALAGEDTPATQEGTPQTPDESLPDESQDAGTAPAADSGWPQGPEITSQAAVVMEDSTGTILYNKNPDMPLQPGSPVKIMTTLLALENSSLSDQVTVTPTGASGVSSASANIGLQEGEVITVEDCLYAIMLASANDAALQVAEQVSGSVDAFVEKMNARAKELGCTSTVFTNPTGLSDDAQISTARDMALITKAAMDNDQFRTIASAGAYTIDATDYSDARNLSNNFALLQSDNEQYYQGCLGGKEGYTEESLSTLACAASRNDLMLIAVVLQGENIQTEAEAVTLLDHGFGNFQKVEITDPLSTVSGGSAMLPVNVSKDSVTVRESEKADGTHQEFFYNNVAVGSAVVQVIHETKDEVKIDGESNLQAAADLTQNKSMTPYYLIAAAGVVLFAGLLALMIRVIKS